MTIEWQYVDEDFWRPYEIGVGVTNPRTSFVVRVTNNEGRSKTKLVSVCEELYEPKIRLNLIDTENERKYTPVLIDIDENEIEEVVWSIKHDGVDYPYTSGQVNAEGVDEVCVSAEITMKCGCQNFSLSEYCYQFTGQTQSCPAEIGIELYLEDGCWKPVRTGNIPCCVALDLILYRLSENHDWSILRDPYETICGNTVYFKRVVTFRDNVCPTMTFEINTGGS